MQKLPCAPAPLAPQKRSWRKRFWFLVGPMVLGLAACGGGEVDQPGTGSPAGAPKEKAAYASVVVFGDSLSDGGTYTLFTPSLPGGAGYLGGRFTNNSPTARVWVEHVAAALSLKLSAARWVKPPEAGGGALDCPLKTDCTNYAEGGARVSQAQGIGASMGFTTLPVKSQIDSHLAKNTSFKATDVVLVWAGSNDLLVQLGAFSAKSDQYKAEFAAGRLDADALKKAQFEAQLAAQDEMKKAAQELTALIRSQILGKGARYVVVMNLFDASVAPQFGTRTEGVKGVISGLAQVFNLWLRDGLTQQPVLWVDAYSLLNAQYAATPLAARSSPACDAAKLNQLLSAGGKAVDVQGSALFCNDAFSLAAGADANTWLFADGLHPTTGAHKILGDKVLADMKAAGWL
jgi:outer membrane lipase/esterase